ncbi:response regulator [Verrucomicrobium sp. BvORR106]|uniref:response regulator n=1 Tax=Verrucomicrobium sp. BvORR106 TaxID=1403819 RepID=UPI0009DF4467|nr:response regulator [Verrucomicrobium sp. BvORR106]
MMSTEARPPESPDTPPSSATIKVLLVDDQRIIGEVVRRMFLDQPDITFHYCADGTQAVARVQEIRPDVILQDLVLPEIDGVELVRQYRAQESSRTTPVIVLSAAEDTATRTRAAEAGANEFMVKPPPKAALIERIRALIGSA